MKKNKMMRLASAMMVMTLMTTSVISGTFAKYTTTASGTDAARVAKWGVEISGIADTLFATTYAKDSETDIANTVSATEKVVAPGTKNNTGVTFSLTGTPEVAVNIDIAVTGSTTDNITDVVLPAANGTYKDWTKAPYDTTFNLTSEYHPVEFTLKDGSTELKKGTLAEIETFLESKKGDYPAGTTLETILGGTTGTYTLTWEWVFEHGSTTEEKAMYDAADTLLGNLAAGNQAAITGASTSIDFKIAITATQID